MPLSFFFFFLSTAAQRAGCCAYERRRRQSEAPLSARERVPPTMRTARLPTPAAYAISRCSGRYDADVFFFFARHAVFDVADMPVCLISICLLPSSRFPVILFALPMFDIATPCAGGAARGVDIVLPIYLIWHAVPACFHAVLLSASRVIVLPEARFDAPPCRARLPDAPLRPSQIFVALRVSRRRPPPPRLPIVSIFACSPSLISAIF